MELGLFVFDSFYFLEPHVRGSGCQSYRHKFFDGSRDQLQRTNRPLSLDNVYNSHHVPLKRVLVGHANIFSFCNTNS